MDTIVQRQSKQKGLADIHSSSLARNCGAFVATFVFTWLLHTWLLRRRYTRELSYLIFNVAWIYG